MLDERKVGERLRSVEEGYVLGYVDGSVDDSNDIARRHFETFWDSFDSLAQDIDSGRYDQKMKEADMNEIFNVLSRKQE